MCKYERYYNKKNCFARQRITYYSKVSYYVTQNLEFKIIANK